MHADKVRDRGRTRAGWRTVKRPKRRHYGARPVTRRVTLDRLEAASPIVIDRRNPGFLPSFFNAPTGATIMNRGHAGNTIRPRLTM